MAAASSSFDNVALRKMARELYHPEHELRAQVKYPKFMRHRREVNFGVNTIEHPKEDLVWSFQYTEKQTANESVDWLGIEVNSKDTCEDMLEQIEGCKELLLDIHRCRGYGYREFIGTIVVSTPGSPIYVVNVPPCMPGIFKLRRLLLQSPNETEGMLVVMSSYRDLSILKSEMNLFPKAFFDLATFGYTRAETAEDKIAVLKEFSKTETLKETAEVRAILDQSNWSVSPLHNDQYSYAVNRMVMLKRSCFNIKQNSCAEIMKRGICPNIESLASIACRRNYSMAKFKDDYNFFYIE